MTFSYDILNQKHGIPNEKHEQLNYEPTIYHLKYF